MKNCLMKKKYQKVFKRTQFLLLLTFYSLRFINILYPLNILD